MSELLREAQLDCDHKESGCTAIRQILEPRSRDLGEFTVRRVIPVRAQRSIGPWIFFDHMGPAQFVAGEGVNVRPHPHINLATVTYLFEGEILHRDSLGSLQTITPGAINLMVAGRGIVHSERERPEVHQQDHALHGLQLWFALPEDSEECEPMFLHYPAESIPEQILAGVRIRVLIGEAYGLSSPVKTFSPTLYIEAMLERGQTLMLPAAQERGLYVATGALQLGPQALAAGQMAILGPEPEVEVTASEPTRLALVGGAPLGQRFMDWNFASSRRERIEQAKQDWQAMRFPAVPGDEEEFIPYPG